MESSSEGTDFLCYSLEDEHRDDKVMGRTRIPSGTYDLGLRIEGGLHKKYSSRFADIHKGMLHIKNVPNFEYICVHCGNDSEDTEGCLLVGDTQSNNKVDSLGFVGKSVQAYKRIYPKIAQAILGGEKVTIEFIDINK